MIEKLPKTKKERIKTKGELKAHIKENIRNLKRVMTDLAAGRITKEEAKKLLETTKKVTTKKKGGK